MGDQSQMCGEDEQGAQMKQSVNINLLNQKTPLKLFTTEGQDGDYADKTQVKPAILEPLNSVKSTKLPRFIKKPKL